MSLFKKTKKWSKSDFTIEIQFSKTSPQLSLVEKSTGKVAYQLHGNGVYELLEDGLIDPQNCLTFMYNEWKRHINR